MRVLQSYSNLNHHMRVHQEETRDTCLKTCSHVRLNIVKYPICEVHSTLDHRVSSGYLHKNVLQ